MEGEVLLNARAASAGNARPRRMLPMLPSLQQQPLRQSHHHRMLLLLPPLALSISLARSLEREACGGERGCADISAFSSSSRECSISSGSCIEKKKCATNSKTRTRTWRKKEGGKRGGGRGGGGGGHIISLFPYRRRLHAASRLALSFFICEMQLALRTRLFIRTH
jgi:hypothetical protein